MSLTLKMHPPDVRVIVDGRRRTGVDASSAIALPPGLHRLIISRAGYFSKRLTIDLQKPLLVEDRLDRIGSSLRRVSDIATGTQPKSVSFTPDGARLIVPLLGAAGIEVIDLENPAGRRRISPNRRDARMAGFVETALLPMRQEVWVSQMQADLVHVFRLSDLAHIDSFPSKGAYPKVIVATSDERTAYVSNWLSRNLSVVDTASREVRHFIPVGGVPRGMVTTPDDRYLYVCLYDYGDVLKIDTRTRRIVTTIDCSPASMRHIVLSPATGMLYASDMWGGRIFAIDSATDSITMVRQIDHKLNTIALAPDGRLLYVSSRGPNNPVDYLLRSPQYGKIYVLRSSTLEVLDWQWGRNQPTGLAVSPDGSLLAFSNFLDHTVEIMELGPRLVGPRPAGAAPGGVAP